MSAATTSVVPSGFQESTVVSGLTNPTNVRFATDGRVFVAEKSGILKEFDSLTSTTPTIVADLVIMPNLAGVSGQYLVLLSIAALGMLVSSIVWLRRR